MTLSLFTQYAAVVAIFALGVAIITLSAKSWFDQVTFTKNFLFQTDYQKVVLESYAARLEDDFDSHVASTPGMRPFMQNLN